MEDQPKKILKIKAKVLQKWGNRKLNGKRWPQEKKNNLTDGRSPQEEQKTNKK